MTGEQRMNVQQAPFPVELEELVRHLRYRRDRGWRVWLESDYVRDPADTHAGESRGLTLLVLRVGPNSYNPDEIMKVIHPFPVPPATFNRESWMRWLFDRLGDVDTHERMEDFALEVTVADQHGCEARSLERPLAPVHAPGFNPYMLTAVPVTETSRATSFRGEVKRRAPARAFLGEKPCQDPGCECHDQLGGIREADHSH
jgi:hypothetical protein